VQQECLSLSKTRREGSGKVLLQSMLFSFFTRLPKSGTVGGEARHESREIPRSSKEHASLSTVWHKFGVVFSAATVGCGERSEPHRSRYSGQQSGT
jgi:hypothetical protein